METWRIGTRKSALAICQTQLTAAAIRRVCPEIELEIVPITTKGDRVQDVPLLSFGGKGVFVEEFEEALLDGTIDLAVHSAKDMPMALSEGLGIAAVLPREDVRDVLVMRKEKSPSDMRLIGTGSPRRKVQLASMEGVTCMPLRGNVPTRLKKLRDGAYDGIVLAAAGLKRLGLDHEADLQYRYFTEEEMVPAGGQGIIAIEAKKGTACYARLAAINDKSAMQALETERYILQKLDAGCHEPIGVYAKPCGAHMEIMLMLERDGVSIKRRQTGKCEARYALAEALLSGIDEDA